MRCFMMKALTHSGEWYGFTINDIPTRFNDKEFALLGKPDTPRLLLNSIRRGDYETGLCEGDIVTYDGVEWLICYERGFYAINADYETKPLFELTDFNIVGDCFSREFPIPILKRNKCLFKYKGTIFRLEDIIGPCDGKIILRSLKKPVDVSDIQQEAGMLLDGQRVYFGDVFPGGTVDMYKGRIAYKNGDVYTDIFTGGIL